MVKARAKGDIMIRKATKKDLKKVAEILRTEFKQPPYNEKWSEKDALKKVKEYFKTHSIFVAETDKEIVGFLIGKTFFWYDGLRGYVDEFAVSSKFQKQGIGKALMKHFEDYLKKKGLKRVGLFTGKKAKAYKIYKKWGFKFEDFVYMEKKLK